jgi:hypothetical protein
VPFPRGSAHGVCSLRCQDQMDMIAHEAVGPYLNTGLAQLLRKHIAVNLLISILEENCLATISALAHMTRKTGDDHARKASHAGKLSLT